MHFSAMYRLRWHCWAFLRCRLQSEYSGWLTMTIFNFCTPQYLASRNRKRK